MSDEKSGVFKFRFDSGSKTVEDRANKKEIQKRLLKSLSAYKVKLILFAVVTLLYSVTFVIFPQKIGDIIDAFASSIIQYLLGLGDGSVFSEIIPYAIPAVAFFVANAVFALLQGYIVSDIITSYSANLRKAVMEKYDSLAVSFIDSTDHGSIISAMTQDVDALNQSLNLLLMRFVAPVITFAVIIITQLITNVTVGIISIIFCILGFGFTLFSERREKKAATKQQSDKGGLYSEAAEFYNGLAVLQNSGKVEERKQSLLEKIKDTSKASEKSQRFAVLQNCISELSVSLCIVFAMVASALMMADGGFSVGGLQCQFVYIRKLFSSSTDFSMIPGILRTAILSAGRIYDFLDIDSSETDGDLVPEKADSPNNIEFRDVTFRYNKDSRYILKNVSFAVKRKGITVISGMTGAGKTTIIKLLLGFYQPQQGKVLFEGKDVSSLKKDDYFSKFNIIVQGSTLFDDTIENNISYGCENVSFEEIQRAAKLSGADEFITRRQDGYKTVFNSKSPNLSDGEIQLVLLARAFLRKREILVFDEATSGLDVIAEKKIIEALQEIAKESCVIVISHRTSSLSNSCDTINVSDSKVKM